MIGYGRQPLVVAVTGHRDLVAAECDGIRNRVRSMFTQLRARYPNLELRLMSPLAAGADQLAAEIALEMSIKLVVPLPMPVPEYEKDFASEESRRSFYTLSENADELFTLSYAPGSSSREEKYAELGIFLASHCHVLLAIWDGKESAKLGGTAQVVGFHHDDIMPGYSPKSSISQQMLIDDESDLVYHVVSSRDRPGGEPLDGLSPTDWFWFTKDENQPRSKDLPASHDIVFRRADEFSRDADRFTDRIAAESQPLLTPEGAALGIDGLEPIDSSFRAADFLAIHYQKRTIRALKVSHVLAFAMGTLFILYADLTNWQLLMYLFLACFAGAAILQQLAARRAWHRKYLDYRTLAEGLRVQFHWAMAGITQTDLLRYSHDNFLQLQDPEVGWIRNTMRVAGIVNDAAPHSASEPLSLVIEEWVGDQSRGQLGYYRTKAIDRSQRHQVTERLGRISLFTSALVVALFLLIGDSIPPALVDPLLVAMGVTLLLFGVRHAYAHAIAERELIKQYEFMIRIFSKARQLLDRSPDETERRQILMALGSSALDEHAQWILLHRERSVDQAEIWRIGSGS